MLTEREIEKQDAVDSEIFDLIVQLSPVEIEWNIQVIADIRDIIIDFLYGYGVNERDFYPYIERSEDD